MSEIYLKPVEMDSATHAAIGRLVRAAAEIEDLVTLAIGQFLGVDEITTGLLLGRSAISTRVGILQTLAKIKGREKESAFAWLFGHNLSNVLACRNAAAHGTLLGLDPDGSYAFQTAKYGEPEPAGAVRLIESYSLERIEEIAAAAEISILLIERDLQLQSLRQKRAAQSLRPHRKGRSQGKSGAK